MPTPKSGYFLKDGTEVPRTTAIIDAFDPKFGLRDWIYQRGVDAGIVRMRNIARELAGEPLEPEVYYTQYRDKAGSVGTEVHALIHAHIKRETPPVSDLTLEQKELALKVFKAFLGWVETAKVDWLESEVMLVSEDFRYGGTLDAVGMAGGKLVLFDWKTSAGAYPSHVLQTAAYRQLWNENRPKPIEMVYLVRFSKTDATFEPYPFPDLDAAWEVFYHHRRALEEMPKVEAALKEARRCMKLEKSRGKSSGG